MQASLKKRKQQKETQLQQLQDLRFGWQLEREEQERIEQVLAYVHSRCHLLFLSHCRLSKVYALALSRVLADVLSRTPSPSRSVVLTRSLTLALHPHGYRLPCIAQCSVNSLSHRRVSLTHL